MLQRMKSFEDAIEADPTSIRPSYLDALGRTHRALTGETGLPQSQAAAAKAFAARDGRRPGPRLRPVDCSAARLP